MANFKPQDANFEARVRTSFARQTAMATLNIKIATLDAAESLNDSEIAAS